MTAMTTTIDVRALDDAALVDLHDRTGAEITRRAERKRRRPVPSFEHGLPVPPEVERRAVETSATYRATHNGCFPTPHRYCGVDSARASVGLPGHCEICAVVGHVVAHPDYGCGDVRCDSDHGAVAP